MLALYFDFIEFKRHTPDRPTIGVKIPDFLPAVFHSAIYSKNTKIYECLFLILVGITSGNSHTNLWLRWAVSLLDIFSESESFVFPCAFIVNRGQCKRKSVEWKVYEKWWAWLRQFECNMHSKLQSGFRCVVVYATALAKCRCDLSSKCTQWLALVGIFIDIEWTLHTIHIEHTHTPMMGRWKCPSISRAYLMLYFSYRSTISFYYTTISLNFSAVRKSLLLLCELRNRKQQKKKTPNLVVFCLDVHS